MKQAAELAELLKKQISRCGGMISQREVKDVAESWVSRYSAAIFAISGENERLKQATDYLRGSVHNDRLHRRKWLLNLGVVIKELKTQGTDTSMKPPFLKKGGDGRSILSAKLLREIRKQDQKIATLGNELNKCWQAESWNACGILMRIILERVIDRKDKQIKTKNGLKNKISHALSGSFFGQSVSGALRKLDNTTKITGDIVAHDSNILLDKDDIEIAVQPFRILLKDIFQ